MRDKADASRLDSPSRIQAAKGKGLIFNIQRYSIHDGPGIRTSVFLKGCPLRCLWCFNPESLSPHPEIFFYSKRCIGCGTCIDVCSQGAIRRINNKIEFDRSLCVGCGKCAHVCPGAARKRVGEWVDPDWVIHEIKKDELFYLNSGGGLTLSGGEPIYQAEFAKQILKECKSHSIHTALESSAYVTWEIFQDMLSYVDMALLDIKHMDSTIHKELTGVDNRLILENIRRVAEMPTALILRFPLIPGHNDSERNLRSMAEFILSLGKMVDLHILPYHSYGVNKYVRLGRKYSLSKLAPPKSKDIERVKSLLESYGLRIKIGG